MPSLSAEKYCALHAGDLFLVNSIDIGEHGIFSGWLAIGQYDNIATRLRAPAYHLLGDLNFLLDRKYAFFQGTGEVNLAEVVAEICLLFDKGDQAIFDLEENGGTGLDIFGKRSIANNCEYLTTRYCQLVCTLVKSGEKHTEQVGWALGPHSRR